MFKGLNKGNKVKIEFKITIVSLNNVPKSWLGDQILVDCKRGSKSDNHKATSTVKASGSSIEWNEQIKITCNFVQNVKSKKLDSKNLNITLKQSKSKTTKKDSKKEKEDLKDLGKVTINLADYTESRSERQENLSIALKSKEKVPSTLLIKIESKWLKINHKALVKKGEGNAKLKAETIEIGGEDYYLQSADEITESTAASVSDHEGEEAAFHEDSVGESEEPNPPEKERSFTAVNNVELQQKHEKEISIMKERYEIQISDLQKDNQRLQRKLDRMATKDDEEPEKKNDESEELRNQIEKLEDEVSNLKKDLLEEKKKTEDQKKRI